MQMVTRCNALAEMVNYTLRALRKELICGYHNPLKTISHRDRTGLQRTAAFVKVCVVAGKYRTFLTFLRPIHT